MQVSFTARDNHDMTVRIPSRSLSGISCAVQVTDAWGQHEVRCSCTAASYGRRCWHRQLAEQLIPLLTEWVTLYWEWRSAQQRGDERESIKVLERREHVSLRAALLGVHVRWERETQVERMVA